MGMATYCIGLKLYCIGPSNDHIRLLEDYMMSSSSQDMGINLFVAEQIFVFVLGAASVLPSFEYCYKSRQQTLCQQLR